MAAVFLTFHLVCFSWIFFRASDLKTAWAYLDGLGRGLSSFHLSTLVVVYGTIVFLLDFPAWYQDEEQPFSRRGLRSSAGS